MNQNHSLDGGKGKITKVVALVERPDGTSQVVNFEREEPLPLDFKLMGSTRINSVEYSDVPARLKFFFTKAQQPDEGKTSAKTNDASKEGQSDD